MLDRALQEPLRQPDMVPIEKQLQTGDDDQQPHQGGDTGNVPDNRNRNHQSGQEQDRTERAPTHRVENSPQGNTAAVLRRFGYAIEQFLQVFGLLSLPLHDFPEHLRDASTDLRTCLETGRKNYSSRFMSRTAGP